VPLRAEPHLYRPYGQTGSATRRQSNGSTGSASTISGESNLTVADSGVNPRAPKRPRSSQRCQKAVLQAHISNPDLPPEPPPRCCLVGGFVSEAIFDAQIAATPAPSESEIAAANGRRAEVKLAEARANQPSLHMGEIETLPRNAGIRVRLTVDAPGRFVVYQNVRVEAGGEFLFQYSECWSLSTSKTQWDYFGIPPHLRFARYKSVTQLWIERQLPGDDRASYKLGRMSPDNDGGTDPTTPWGATHGRWDLRTVPPNTTPILRQTILRWDDNGVLRQPIEIVSRRPPSPPAAWS
jgi:hypothetical protein